MTTASSDSISSPALRERLDSPTPPALIDVRTPAEFETAHIVGSRNIPLDTLRNRRDEVSRFDGDIVLVCRSGQRAAQARDILHAEHPGRARVLHGGLLDWDSNGFDVQRGEQRWELERQVRLVAGSIVLSSVLGSAFVPRLKWVAAAIGGGLTYAALSNTCAMASVLSKLPYNQAGGAREPDA